MESKNNGIEEYSSYGITEDILFDKFLSKLNITRDIANEWNETGHLREFFRKFIIGSSDPFDYPEKYVKNVLIIIFYSLIIIVSLFGNLLVMKVILSRLALRKRTTNILIMNLSASDLIMTVFAIPITVARLILDDWPFGSCLCFLAPFIQVTSIYVSTLTMTIIALDRYQVLINPLKTRLCSKAPKYVIIGVIWIISGLLSIPHSIYNKKVELFSFRPIFRCRTVYPEPQIYYRRLFTVLTTSTQYLIPLSVTFFTYGLIAYKIYRKKIVGEITEQQLHQRLNSKYKTIKMLMTVVIIFAVCWLPINSFHIIYDFFYFESKAPVGYNTFLVCHWLAFSSVCWNPFIYFGLNNYYRQGLSKIFSFTKSLRFSSNNSVAQNTRSSALLSHQNSKASERKLSVGLINGKINDRYCVSPLNITPIDNNNERSSHKNKSLIENELIPCFSDDKERTGTHFKHMSTNI